MIIESIMCLALNTYHEAKNQSFVGQVAVAQVVMNRVKDNRYPNNVCDVVKQGLTYKWKPTLPIRNKCQFSWYCDGKPDDLLDPDSYQRALEVAEEMLENDVGLGLTDGADHYHAVYIVPSWAKHMTFIVTIENHKFYRSK